MVAGLARCESEHVGVLAVDMPFAADTLVHVLSTVAGQPAADAWVPVDDAGRQQWFCAGNSGAFDSRASVVSDAPRHRARGWMGGRAPTRSARTRGSALDTRALDATSG